MASRAESKKARLASRLRELRPSIVDEHLFAEFQVLLNPVSESYLRRLLRHSGIPLSPLVEGVSLESLDESRRTLRALSELYVTADSTVRSTLRQRVIEGKTRLRFLVPKTPDPVQRALREEMLLQVSIWLENPGVFPVWLGLRERATHSC